MAFLLNIQPDDPQPRLLRQAAELLRKGEVLAVPTDSSYALICHLDDKAASDQLRRIRQMDDKHLLTLLCRDQSELSSYARVDNRQFRLLKQATPGPFVFVLEASKEVPRRLSHPSRKTIGLRVPAHKTLLALLEEHGAPLLSASLILPGDEDPLNDPDEIMDRLEHQVAAVVASGSCPLQPTTVVDLTPMDQGEAPELIRHGAGDPALLGL